MQIKINVKPMPLGDAEEYFLQAEQGTRIHDLLPEDFEGLVCHNKNILLYNQNPEILETDEIEFLIPLHGGGGGDKDGLRTVAFLAVAVASYGAGTLFEAPFASFLAATATNIAGGLLINELIPPQIPDQSQPQAAGEVPGFQTKSLSGSRNKPGSYSLFPKLYGERRVKPYYAASPYTEIVGNDQYIHMLFFLNQGAISVLDDTASRIIAGRIYNNSYENRSITVTPDTATQLQSGTIKIDETALDALEDWKVVIGSPLQIQASTQFRDAEVAYPGINFESGYTRQEEPFTLKKITRDTDVSDGIIDSEIIDLGASSNYSAFEFTVKNAASIEKYDVLFQIQYESVSNYGSDTWVDIYPNTDSSFYDDTIASSGIGLYWVSEGAKTKSSSIILNDEIIGRLRVLTPFIFFGYAFNLTFKTFKFYEDSFAVFTSAPNTYASSIDLTAQNGLYSANNKNERKKLEIRYKVEYREANTTNAWQTVESTRTIGASADTTAKDLRISGNSAQTYRAGLYWEYPSVGQYDVRVTPIYKSSYEGYAQESVTWEVLKSYQSKGNAVWAPFIDDLAVPTDYPDYVNLKQKPVLMYLKIKAQPTLQGNTDNISIKCASVLRSLNATGVSYYDKNHSTSLAVSSNPANIYADVVFNGSTVKELSEDKLDFEKLQELENFCNTYNLYYNNYEVNEETILTRINKVLSVGLGKFGTQDEKFSVIRDIQDQIPVQVITPVNCNSFSATKTFNKKIHGVKVQYTDSNTWETEYVVVYNTGYNLAGTDGKTAASEFVTLEVEGITDVEVAKIYGRYHLANLTLRPETFNVNMDIEQLRLEVGDCTYISYDTIKVGENYGRIKGIFRDGSNNVVYIETAELIQDVLSGKGIAFRLQNGESFQTTYPVDEASTTETKIYLETPQPIDINIGDVYVYGDIGSEKLKAKVTKIYPGKDMTADIEMTNAAEEIHETYTIGNIPSYKPVIDSRAEVGIDRPPKLTVTNTQSGDDFVVTSEALAESFCIKIDFTVPYTLVGIDEIVMEYTTQFYETSAYDEAVFEPGVFEEGVFEALSSSAVKREIQDKTNWEYIGQDYIIFEAIPNADYEIKLYTNKKRNGRTRVSEPALITHSTLQGIVPAPSTVTYTKSLGENIYLSWPDVNTNYPVVYRIFEYDTGSSSWILIGTTDNNNFNLGRRFTESLYAVKTINPNSNNGSFKTEISINEPYPEVGTVYANLLAGKMEISWSRRNPEIAEYEVRRGTTWETGVLVGKTAGSSIIVEKTQGLDSYGFMIRGNLIDGGSTDVVFKTYNFTYPQFGDISTRLVDGRIEISWERETPDITTYEIREGIDWDTGSVLGRTAGSSILINKELISTFNFMLRGDLNFGEYTEIAYINYGYTYPTVGEVFINRLDGKMEISWTRQSPEITEYEIRRGTTWETGSLVGKTAGSSIVVEKSQDLDAYAFMIRGNLVDEGSTDVVYKSYTFTYPTFGDIATRLVDGRIEISWERETPDITVYEIREGTDWYTGSVLGRTAGSSIIINKENLNSFSFMLRGELNFGNYTNIAYINYGYTYPAVGTISGRTLDGKIELSWSRQSPEITEYEIREGTDWETGTLITKTSASSVLIQKDAVQVYNFMIRGNLVDEGNTDIVYVAYNYPYGLLGTGATERPGIGWDKDIHQNVGPGELFETLESAFAYYGGLFPAYRTNGEYRVYLYLQSDYVIQEQIKVENFDLSFVTVKNTTGVPIEIDLQAAPISFGFFNDGESVHQCKPIFYGIDSKMPTFEYLDFNVLNTTNNNGTSFIFLDNSQITIDQDFNLVFDNYGVFGFFIKNNSILKAKQTSNNFQIDNVSCSGLYVENSKVSFSDSNYLDINCDASSTTKTWLVIGKKSSTIELNNLSSDFTKLALLFEGNTKVDIEDLYISGLDISNEAEKDYYVISATNNTQFELGTGTIAGIGTGDDNFIWAGDNSNIYFDIIGTDINTVFNIKISDNSVIEGTIDRVNSTPATHINESNFSTSKITVFN